MLIDKNDMKSGLDFFFENTSIDLTDKDREDFQNILESLDYRQYATAKYLQNNHKVLNKKDWNDIYEQYKHIPAIKQLILSFKEVPYEIIEKAISETNIIRSGLKHFGSQPEDERKILRLALKHELRESTLKLICEHMDKNFIASLLEFEYSLTERDVANYHPNSINQVCRRLIDIFDYISSPEHMETVLHFFQYNPDKEFIKEIVENDRKMLNLNEQIRENIINNIYLDPHNPDDKKIMNDLFNAGIGYNSRLTVYTEEIADAIIKQQDIWNQYLTQIGDDALPISRWSGSGSFFSLARTLANIAATGNLPVAIERDIAQRYTSKKQSTYNILVESIYNNTKTEDVMKTFLKMPNKLRKEMLLKNPNVPHDMVYEYLEKYFKKMKSLIKNGKTDETPGSWFSDIPQFAKKFPLKDEHYELLFKASIYLYMFEHIATYDSTPIDVLNKIIDLKDNMLKNISEESIDNKSSFIFGIGMKAILCKEFREQKLDSRGHTATILFSRIGSERFSDDFLLGKTNFETNQFVSAVLDNYFNDKELNNYIKILKSCVNKVEYPCEKNYLQTILDVFVENREKRQRKIHLENTNYIDATENEIMTAMNDVYIKHHSFKPGSSGRGSFVSESEQEQSDFIIFIETCSALNKRAIELEKERKWHGKEEDEIFL